MQERVYIEPKDINKDLMKGMTETPLWYWIAVGCLALGLLSAAISFGIMTNKGLGMTGLNRPVFWGFFITNFVFWVGISHAGVMISAILRLTGAEWRRPVTRAAEVLTIFTLLTAALMPLIHTGRPWRILYWFLPYDFSRGIWPDPRSPLVWDPASIFTYLTGSILFVYVALIPDLAVARDRSTGWRFILYSILSLGFRGNPRQWKLQAVAGILLSALILPVFVSVHSIVSWDFAVNIGVEGWHATIFAPYFVIGAVHSGVSAVVTMMALMRWLWGWDKYIRPEHFDGLGRLLIVVACTWFYFFIIEFFFGMFSQESPELALRHLQMFEWPYNMLFIIFLLTGFFIPVPLWLFRKVRRNIALMFWSSILVNIGMWIERFIIIVPSLQRKQPFTFVWGSYSPSIIEILIVLGTFCMVGLGLLAFSKLFPLIPIFDIKEGQILHEDIEIGRVKVPGVIKE